MNLTEDRAKQALELTNNLIHFTGSETWHKHFTGMLYTDGIQYLADKAGAYWLIDVAASYQIQPKIKAAPFQIWTLDVDLENQTGIVSMREDTDEPELVHQVIPFTDFPLATFSFYVVDGTMLLKSEY